MEIRVLGCSGGRSPGHELTSYLVDDSLLVDTGAAASAMDLAQQESIADVLITHAHLDHIIGISHIYQNTMGSRIRPLEVYATEPSIQRIREHLLTPAITPFLPREDGAPPGINFHAISLEIPFKLGRYEVEAIGADHIPGSVAFRVSDGEQTFLFTGDTGPVGDVFNWMRDNPVADCVVAEVSFPSEMEALAEASQHLTPKTLVECLQKAEVPAERKVHINHLKPAFLGELYDQIESKKDWNLVILRKGDKIYIDKSDDSSEILQREIEKKVSDKIPEFDRAADLYQQRSQIERDFGVSARAGETIFRQGDNSRIMYIIREGRVRISRRMGGAEKLLSELGPGDFFGEMAMLNNRPRSATAIALSDVTLLAFDKHAFENLLTKNFGVALRVIRTLTQRLQETDNLIENLLYFDPESKVINTLVNAAYDEGIETAEGWMVRTTPEKISERSGVILPTLREVFKDLIKKKFIITRREAIIIPNTNKLRRLLKFLDLKNEFD